MRTLFLALFFCGLLFSQAFSQANKPCNGLGAPSLTVQSACTGSTWSLSDLGGAAYGNNNGDFGTPSCGSPGAADGWFSFTAPASGNITITTSALTLTNVAFEVYESDCSTYYTSYNCFDGPGMQTGSLTGLTGGLTYYIRMWAEGGSNGSFNICVEDDGGTVSGCTNPAAHNYNAAATVDNGSCQTCSDGIQNGDETATDCGGALCSSCGCVDTYGSLSTALCSAPNATVDGSCVNGDNTNVSLCATGSCLNQGSQDFMRFTATATDVTVTMTSSGIQDVDVAIISLGSACPTPGTPSILSCATSTGSGSVSVSASGLNISDEYYIAIESLDTDEGTFQICVTSPTYGCTDASAHNYNASATVDDGSCETCSDGITNGDEVSVDCGGSSCPPCSGGTTVIIGSMGTYSGCNANFYDTGGSAGAYANSEVVSKLLCAASTTECMQFVFSTFSLEGCCDYFRIYDGTTNADPLIGSYNGSSLNGQAIQSTGQCLYVEFTSDGSVTYPGWDAYVTCITCPTCTDGIQNGSETGVDCGGSCPTTCPGSTCADPWVISSLPYSAAGASTCGAGDDYTSADACGSLYMDGDDVVYQYTSSGNECLDITMSNSGSYAGMFLLDGCPNSGGTSCLASATSSSGNPSMGYTISSAGTYYIVISTWPSPQCIGYDLDITSSAAGAAGSTCGNPYTIGSVPFSATGLTTSCYGDDYSSADACGSTYMNGDDFVFEYTAGSDDCVSITLSNTSSYTGVFVMDGCPSGGGTTCIASNTSTSGNPSTTANVIGGTTYYIVVSTSPSPQSTPFDISITSNGGTPSNNDCVGATALTLGTYEDGTLDCTDGVGEAAAPSCWYGTDMNTVWYSVVAPASGELTIATNMDDPTPSSGYGTQIEVFSGMGCGSLSSLGCNVDAVCGGVSTSSLELTGLTSGNTYYIRVDGEYGETPDFTIVAIDPTDASTLPAGSECGAPQPVCSAQFNVGDPGFQGIGVACDFPGTGNCTSGERGSAWYTIEIANNGTLEFDIIPNDWSTTNTCINETDYDFIVWKINGSGSTNCATIESSLGDGEVACNFSGYGVTGLSSSGNAPAAYGSCFDGAYEPALSVTAGDIYLISIQNYSNSTSGFTLDITNSATEIDTTSSPLCGNITMSTKMVYFDGEKMDDDNFLKWTTVVESDHDYFELERSFDGKEFEVIATIPSRKGTSYAATDYQYSDKNVMKTAYYKLNNVSINGNSYRSKTIVIDGDAVIPFVYPNPAKEVLYVNYQSSGTGTVRVMSLTGEVVKEIVLTKSEGVNATEICSLEGLSAGTYLVQVKTTETSITYKLSVK